MIYYDTVKRQLTQQEIDGNFEQLMLRAKRLGAQDMPITLRKDLTRPLTPREMDTNFQSLDLVVKKARYGDGPYPAAEYIFDGATVLPAGITFTRPSKAWGWRNGVLVEYDVDEPVFEDGGLRLEPQATNSFVRSTLPTENKYVEGDGFIDVSNGTSFVIPEWGQKFTVGGAHAGLGSASSVSTDVLVTAQILVRGLTENAEMSINSHGTTGQHRKTYEFSNGVISEKTSLGNFIHSEIRSLGGGWKWVRLGWRTLNSDTDRRLGFNFYEGSTWEVAHIQREIGNAIPTSIIPTFGSTATRAADQFQWTGAAFSSIFNPSQGALVLPHSSYGEGNIITLGGLQVARTEDGLELNNTAIPDTEDAKQNLKLRWGSNGLDVFVGDTKAVHDIPLPANWGDADSLVLAGSDSTVKYIERLAAFATAPTDSNMEGM